MKIITSNTKSQRQPLLTFHRNFFQSSVQYTCACVSTLKMGTISKHNAFPLYIKND